MNVARRRLTSALLFGVTVSLLSGCASTPLPRRLDPIPMAEAAAIVNQNLALITHTLRAIGSVDGTFTDPDGATHSYHLNGVLFYLSPAYLRFDLKKFGERQLLIGSNSQGYWFYDKQNDEYHCGRHGQDGGPTVEIPIRPDHIVDALGLTPIILSPNVIGAMANGERQIADGQKGTLSPNSPFAIRHSTFPVKHLQRVVEDFQQVLVLTFDEAGDCLLEREYWLDRYWPRLVRRVVFRDADGVVEMHSTLADYKPLGSDGPLLPGVMTAEWPELGSTMRFRVSKWTMVESVGPDSIQFATPKCR